MKRQQLIKTLRNEAKAQGTTFTFVREGANHEMWAFGETTVTIPRHREINEGTARSIINHCTKEA